MKYKIINRCQICNGHLKDFLDLGKQPLCDDLTVKPNSSNFYKLKVSYCNKCLTAYQKYNIQKKILFPKNYHYRSSNTKDVVEGMRDLVKSSKKYLKNLKSKNVLDIGCNDGTLLSLFKKEGCNTFGIEPTKASVEAKKKGHVIFKEYFDKTSSKNIRKIIGNIDIITFTNVFAHIEDLEDLLFSLKNISNKNTLIIIENHYLGEVIKKTQFDTFYHEHPRTYSLKSFVNISKKININLIDFKFVKRYNGNIRVYLKSFGKIYKSKKKLSQSLRLEKLEINKIKTFQKKVNKWKLNKKKEIEKITEKFGPLPAKAFPGRASISINLLRLNSQHISKVYEKNSSLKVNKFIPGTDIKILKEKYFKVKQHDKGILINLAWHISDEINNYLRQKMKFKGKIIDIISNKDFK
ncbi:methyltransferase domain-containing protein [Pelagibacterales bacterium SAG-MED38]|nr:methyltransferase domain-containing protein [Pelagibacterales bacterium SAG-MED38]